jgi:hypothetical protein
MFLVPEILWSPIVNELYSTLAGTKNGSFQMWRNNFLFEKGNLSLWAQILFVQFLGMFFSTIVVFLAKKNIQNKILFWVLFVLMSIITIFLYLVFDSSVNFKPRPIL